MQPKSENIFNVNCYGNRNSSTVTIIVIVETLRVSTVTLRVMVEKMKNYFSRIRVYGKAVTMGTSGYKGKTACSEDA